MLFDNTRLRQHRLSNELERAGAPDSAICPGCDTPNRGVVDDRRSYFWGSPAYYYALVQYPCRCGVTPSIHLEKLNEHTYLSWRIGVSEDAYPSASLEVSEAVRALATKYGAPFRTMLYAAWILSVEDRPGRGALLENLCEEISLRGFAHANLYCEAQAMARFLGKLEGK